MTATYLDKILEFHRARAAADERSEAWLHEAIASKVAADPVDSMPRGFADALRNPGLSVISEIKRRSPSRGDLFADLEPDRLALEYQAGGAAALSVLTDADHFGGSILDLVLARKVVTLPVIRKDFTVDRRDVLDARLMGADCVLLIVAALNDEELAELAQLAQDLGLDALIETHDEAEVQRATAIGATLIGVNQRDLVSFEVDTTRAIRVRQAIPADAVAVAESGIRGPEDAAALAAAGYNAILVGESLVTSGDPAAAVHALVEAGGAAS
ncbi:MAG: indole-3-glycerol phosphate synthase TrpC [Acidimicrobiales bacterium]